MLASLSMDNRSRLINTTTESPHWQMAFSSGIRSLRELMAYIGFTSEAREFDLPSEDQLAQFPVRVPLSYANKIEKLNPRDPLLLQVLPSAQEFIVKPGYVKDPLAECDSNPVPGVIHKYKNRVLLVATQACLIHCRYCFRRHFPYDENSISSSHIKNAIRYIEQNQSIDEVILSGGDPLSMSDAKLIEILELIVSIPHIKRLRIHSRLMAIIPSRATTQFLEVVMALGKPVVMVLHINHPHEIDQALIEACIAMRYAGLHLFSQSVLLRGVNDDLDTLKSLSVKIFDAGVLPYYLHLFDSIEGGHHFDVPIDEGKRLMTQLQSELSGYLVPKFVMERPGLQSKFLIPFDIM